MDRSVKSVRYYAGIGRRTTPNDVCQLMTRFAAMMQAKRYVLRSGGADGADDAFEQGVDNPAYKQIFLPWSPFNGRRADQPGMFNIGSTLTAIDYLQRFHPAVHKLSAGAAKLLTRNVYQILGPTCNVPVTAVVCWAEDLTKGGTAFAVAVARHHQIPVFNLYQREVRNNIEQSIEQFDKQPDRDLHLRSA